MESNGLGQKVPFLTGTNWGTFKIKFRAMGNLQNWFIACEPEMEEVEETSADGSKKTVMKAKKLPKDANKNAISALHLYMSEETLPYIAHFEEAAEAWKVLKDMHEGKTVAQIRAIKRKMAQAKMTSDQTIKTFFAYIMDLANQRRARGSAVTEEEIVECLMNGLSEEYESIITLLNNTLREDEFTIAKVLPVLEEHEVKLTTPSESNRVLTLLSRSGKYHDYKCTYCGNPGHMVQGCEKRKRDVAKGVWEPACWGCGETGHEKKDCPKRKGNQAQQGGNARRPMIALAARLNKQDKAETMSHISRWTEPW